MGSSKEGRVLLRQKCPPPTHAELCVAPHIPLFRSFYFISLHPFFRRPAARPTTRTATHHQTAGALGTSGKPMVRSVTRVLDHHY